MNQSRHALTISLFYSLPLLTWLSAQLDYIGWSATGQQSVFHQLLAILLLFQAMATVLLLINKPVNKWQHDVSGLSYILLFPMPFLALIWLTGSASLLDLTRGLVLVVSVAAFAFLIRRSTALIPARLKILESGLSLAYVLIAVMIWNYRELWWDWLAL